MGRRSSPPPHEGAACLNLPNPRSPLELTRSRLTTAGMHPRPQARLRSLVRWCSRGLSLGACGATEDVPRPKPGLIRVCQRPLRASLAGRTNASVPTWAFLVLALPSMSPVSTHPKNFLSDKVEHFTESVIREMTRQAMQYGAVNLAQ